MKKIKKNFSFLIVTFFFFFTIAGVVKIDNFNILVNAKIKEKRSIEKKVKVGKDISFNINLIKEEKSKKLKKENSKDNERKNISKYKDYSKIEKRAGLNIISISNKNNKKENFYNISKNLKIENQLEQIEKQQKINNNFNTIKVINNKIVEMDKGIVSTIGGYDSVKYMYNSIAEAEKEENGTSISGGAFEGSYLKTVKVNNKYYIKAEISGFSGFIPLEDVQLIPSNLIKSQSYYVNQNGIWYFNEAIDPLISTEYQSYAMDNAPSWAKENIKYYSNNDIDFFENNLDTNIKNVKSNENYFQNLPLRSTSKYSGDQYKNYLKGLGKTNSKYYNATNSFVEAQDKEYVNSLFLFAMANHEGAYGTSNFSNKCNNFFGRGAFDSNPNNACKEYGFSSPRDGILAQSLFLEQNYADVDWFGYHGTEPGNKDHGMNVSYASDPNWGKALASMMYNIDQNLKGKENNYYRIFEVKSSKSFKKEADLKNSLKKKPQRSGEQDYVLPRHNSKNPRLVVVGETTNSIKVQLPMGKNLDSSKYVTWSDAKKGKYADYEGRFGNKGNYDNYVNSNVANFATKYKDWDKQTGWYPKSATKFIAGSKEPVSPGDSNSITYCSNNLDQIEKKEIVKVNNEIIQKQKFKYDCSTGKEIFYTNKKYKNNKIIYLMQINHYNPDGEISFLKKNTYYTNGRLLTYNESNYNQKGKRNQRIYKDFKNNKIKHNTEYKYSEITGTEIMYINKSYYDNGKIAKLYQINHYNPDGVISFLKKNYYNKDEQIIESLVKYYDEKGNII